MRKFLLCVMLALALPLAACDGLPTINIQNQVNLNTTQGVVAGYGILANQLELMKQQPLCKTGTTPSLANICVPRSTLVRLQAGMVIAQKAMNAVVAFEAANPTVSPAGYISAASSALLAVQGVYNSAATATSS